MAVASATAVGRRSGAPARRLSVDHDAAPTAAGAAGAGPARAARRLGVGLVDDVFVDFELTLGERHTGAPEVGEHVGDGRAALLRDISDRSHASHLPHRLSLIADVGEASAQIFVDGHARPQGAVESPPARRLLETVRLWAEPGSAAGRVRFGDHDALALQGQSHERVDRGDSPAADAGALRRAGLTGRRHSAVTCPAVSASASFW
jgi:hypothetical protein